MQLNTEVTETIQCPFCGQSFDLVADTSTPRRRLTRECGICCAKTDA
jgi:hypothetical protein